jgi:hypothetical protein
MKLSMIFKAINIMSYGSFDSCQLKIPFCSVKVKIPYFSIQTKPISASNVALRNRADKTVTGIL